MKTKKLSNKINLKRNGFFKDSLNWTYVFWYGRYSVILRLIYINYVKDITGFCNGKITIVYFLNTFSCSNFARSLLTFDWKEVFPSSDSLEKIRVCKMPWSLWAMIIFQISSCLFTNVGPVFSITALLISSPFYPLQ